MSVSSLSWIHEAPPYYDDDKARIVGGAAPGTFAPAVLAALKPGQMVPGEWWRVTDGGRTVGYGWMDTSWGDAQILLAVDPAHRKRGLGTFIVDHLEQEARARGLNYLFNTVAPEHPDAAGLTAWLGKRGFRASEDGKLLRAVVKAR